MLLWSTNVREIHKLNLEEVTIAFQLLLPQGLLQFPENVTPNDRLCNFISPFGPLSMGFSPGWLGLASRV